MSVVKDQSYQSKDFYNDLFQQMVEKCVTNDQMSDLLLERLVKELNDFDDVRYYFYKDFAYVSQRNIALYCVLRTNMLWFTVNIWAR